MHGFFNAYVAGGMFTADHLQQGPAGPRPAGVGQCKQLCMQLAAAPGCTAMFSLTLQGPTEACGSVRIAGSYMYNGDTLIVAPTPKAAVMCAQDWCTLHRLAAAHCSTAHAPASLLLWWLCGVQMSAGGGGACVVATWHAVHRLHNEEVDRLVREQPGIAGGLRGQLGDADWDTLQAAVEAPPSLPGGRDSRAGQQQQSRAAQLVVLTGSRGAANFATELPQQAMDATVAAPGIVVVVAGLLWCGVVCGVFTVQMFAPHSLPALPDWMCPFRLPLSPTYTTVTGPEGGRGHKSAKGDCSAYL